MGLGQLVDRLYRTITPRNNRVLGGTFLTHLPAMPAPAGGVQGVTLTPGAAITAYGNWAAIATAKVVPTECWIEGIECMIAANTGAERILALQVGAVAGLATAGICEAQVGVWVNTGAAPGPQGIYVPLTPPIYVRAPTAAETLAGTNRIQMAVASAAAANTIDVKLHISHRK